VRYLRVTCVAVGAGLGGVSGADAQAPPTISIPLELIYASQATPFPAQWRLGINVGINAGPTRSYLFDTGSSLFNAAYTQSYWPGINPPTGGTVPNSTVPNGSGVTYCYGSSDLSTCRGYQGNIVQATSLQFYTAQSSPGGQTIAAALNASPGFQVNALYNQLTNGQPTSIVGTTTPVEQGGFFGVFGAGAFTTHPDSNPSYTTGGVLGQAIVAGATQGYVVAANGQVNPVTNGPKNPPQQVNGQNVLLGVNPAPQAVTACSPCVMLGLTPELIGQFAVAQPASGSAPPGTISWATAGPGLFPNPYGGATGNNATAEMGIKLNVTLTAGSSTLSSTASGLLDTGTGGNTLTTLFQNQPGFSGSESVRQGVTLGVTGLTPDGSPIPGVTQSTATLGSYDPSSAVNYTAQFDHDAGGTTNTIGLGFFLQNSVLFDLDNKAIGYTNYFVTNTDMSTAGGPLIVGGSNLPLGLAGVISGTGGVTIQEGGNVQLSAANTYTGATSITAGGKLLVSGIGSIASSSSVVNDGTFDISRAWAPVAIEALSGNGKVNLGGQNLTIANGSNGTFYGTIADGGSYPGTGGSLTIAGGSQALAGVNTYTGLTTVAAGARLYLGPVASIASSSGLANDGTFDMSYATQPVFLQDIYGAGQMNLGKEKLTVTNASGLYSGVIADGGGAGGAGASLALTGGMLVLTNANTYSGGTSVSGGATLGIAADGSLGNATGGLNLNDGTLAAMGTITSARAVTLGAGGGTIDTNGFGIAFSNALSGPGSLTKTGAGILTLDGANTFTGGTVVSQGTLALTGSMTGSLAILSGATFTSTGGWSLAPGTVFNNAGTFQSLGGAPLVNQGTLIDNGTLVSNLVNAGTLGGNGTIFGSVTNNGIASPGNSIGTLNVVGAYTQAAGSSYQVEVNASGQSDLVNVAGAPGTATINGGMVNVLPAWGVYAPSTTYTILSATGGVTGAYAGVGTSLPFLQSSLAYDANNVYLTLRPGGFATGAQTPNQMAVGGALDRGVAGASGDFATVVGTMASYSLTQGQAAMTTLSGQGYSGFGTANLGGGLLFLNALGQQMSMVRGGAGGRVSRMALAEACDVDCNGEPPSRWGLWGTALGGTGTVAGNGNAASLTYNAGGFATGLDHRFDPRFLAGLGVGFSSGNQWASGFSGQGTTNSYQASLYASFTPGAFYLDALAGYGYNDNAMTRQITLPNLAPRLAQGRTGANQFLGQLEAGYRIAIDGPAALALTPFARFQGTTVNQAGFTESGAGALNLTVARQTSGSARSVLGAELAGAFGAEGREKLAVQLRAGWAHEYASNARPVTANFAGAPGTSFTVFGAAPQTDSAIVSVAANMAIASGAGLYLRYDGEVGAGISSHSLSGGFRATW
jgi:autotransporter-associated beta strand protein